MKHNASDELAQLRAAIPVSQRQVININRAQGKVRSVIQKEAETYQAGIACVLGMPNRTLARMTGLSLGQVAYRTAKTGASEMRRDYRDGKGPVIEFLLSKARPMAEAEFVERMREKLGLQVP